MMSPWMTSPWMTSTTGRTTNRTHVVIVGGGFAGLAALHGLRGKDVDVTLVDRHSYNTFQPLLYQVATAALNPGDITWFLRAARFRQRNIRVVNGTVTAMDHGAQEVVLAAGQRIHYDQLIVAAGASVNYFGVPGAEEHALPLYTRSNALAIRDAMFSRLEQAVVDGSGGELRVIIVGGGATGVEMAGAIAELRNESMPVTYPELEREATHVTVMEMLPSLLAPFPETLRAEAARSLAERDVEVRLDTAVKEVRPDGVVDGNGDFTPAGLVIWASGVAVHPVVADWDLPQGSGGRVLVDRHFRVRGLDNVLAVGDIAATEEDPLPQLAQPAIQAGRHAARVVLARLRGADVPDFHYRDRGSLATIGRGAAVADVQHLPPLKGFPAWLLWMVVHLAYLLGARNRLATVVNLCSRYLFRRHGHAAIVGETDPRSVDRAKE